jgi:ubiquinone/menaquinone biosynthesis C-methylase UbiE
MTKFYFNGKADIWDEKIAEKDPGKMLSMAESLDIPPGSAVLDVGTGTGVFIPFLLPKIGPNGKLVCLDYAEVMLNKARAKNFRGNIEYLCADIEDCHLEKELFDAVVCYSSFPHFHNKTRALAEIYRMLKKGGRLFICHTSSREGINHIHRQIPGLDQDLIPDDIEMRGLLSSTDFQEIIIHSDDRSYLTRAKKIGLL